MKTRTVAFLAVLALALGACATAEPTPQIIYVEVTATPVPSTPTPAPTATPARVTTDAHCDADWANVVEGGNWEGARAALSMLLSDPASALPGSAGEYLLWCVDEGWRGYFETDTSTGASG